MRVSNATMFQTIQTQLGKLAEGVQHTNLQIASEQKYLKISDNPVEVGNLMGLNNESNLVTQYQANLSTGKYWLNTADNTLININSLVSSTASLAEQMATSTYNAQQRQSAAQQVQQNMEEIMQEGNVSYQGSYIFSGYKTDTSPFSLQNFTIQDPAMSLQSGSTGAAAITTGATYTGSSSATYIVQIVAGGATGAATYQVSQDGGQTWSATAATGAAAAIGSDGVQVDFSGNWVAGDKFTVAAYQPITYQGDDNALNLSIGQNSRLQVSQVGSQAVGGGGDANDIFKIMADLKSAMEANDTAAIGAKLEDLRDYQSHLTSVQAWVGASTNRVTVKTNAYTSLNTQLTQTISDKGDTDIIAASQDLLSKQNAYQAALWSSNQVMNMSLLNYL